MEENGKTKQGKISTKGMRKQSITGSKLSAKENIEDYVDKSEDSENNDSDLDEDVHEGEHLEVIEKCLFPTDNNIEA